MKKMRLWTSLVLICFAFLLVLPTAANAATGVTLTAPTLTVSNNTATGKIVLTWTAVDGAEKYEVYRSASKDGAYTRLTATTGTKLTNSSINAGETYYYKVRAVAGETKGKFSTAIGRTCDLARPVATVTNNTSTGKIVLTWKAVTGADRYEVWRSTSRNGTYTKVMTTTGLKMTHSSAKPGETFYYKVKAICDANASGNSAFSEAVGRTCDLAQPRLTVTNNTSTGKIVLTWKAVTGADRYEVWRSTSKNGTYTKIYTTTGLKLTNSSVAAGETYYYKVRAICDDNASGNSAYSAAVGRTCDLARPVVTIAASSKGKPVLTWQAVAGAVKYEVWRSTEANGTFTKFVTTTGLKIIHSGAEKGDTYYYKVKAICEVSAGNSAFSDVRSFTVAADVYAVVQGAQWINAIGEEGYCLANLLYADGNTATVKVRSVNGYECQYSTKILSCDFFVGEISTTYQYNQTCNDHLCKVVVIEDGVVELETHPSSEFITHYDGVVVEDDVSRIGTAIRTDDDTLFVICDSDTGSYRCVVGYDALEASYVNCSVDVVVGSDGIAECVYVIGTEAEKSFEDADAWGRPQYCWRNHASEIVFAQPLEPVVVFMMAATHAEIAAALGMENADDIVARYFNDGVSSVYDTAMGEWVENTITIDPSGTSTVGGQGTTLEVYSYTDENGEHQICIVEVEVYLARVVEVSEEVTDKAGHVVSPAYVTLDVFGIGEVVVNATGYAVDDYLLVCYHEANTAAGILCVADSFTGSQTILWWNAAKHTVDGITYFDNENYVLDEAAYDKSNIYRWFVDTNGNIIGSVLYVQE